MNMLLDADNKTGMLNSNDRQRHRAAQAPGQAVQLVVNGRNSGTIAVSNPKPLAPSKQAHVDVIIVDGRPSRPIKPLTPILVKAGAPKNNKP